MAERLRLYYPIKPHLINQRFGENDACVKDFGLPSQVVKGSNFEGVCPLGYEKLYPKFGMAGHNGMDLNTGEHGNVNIYAACDGVVVEKQTVPARGLGLGILTNVPMFLDEFGEHYAKVRYWHLKSFMVEVGDTVKAGDLIGVSDNTGYSAGDHLHFELDPMDKDAGGHPYLTNPQGAIAGSINPESYFTGIHASDLTTVIQKYNSLISILQAWVGALMIKK